MKITFVVCLFFVLFTNAFSFDDKAAQVIYEEIVIKIKKIKSTKGLTEKATQKKILTVTKEGEAKLLKLKALYIKTQKRDKVKIVQSVIKAMKAGDFSHAKKDMGDKGTKILGDLDLSTPNVFSIASSYHLDKAQREELAKIHIKAYKFGLSKIKTKNATIFSEFPANETIDLAVFCETVFQIYYYLYPRKKLPKKLYLYFFKNKAGMQNTFKKLHKLAPLNGSLFYNEKLYSKNTYSALYRVIRGQMKMTNGKLLSFLVGKGLKLPYQHSRDIGSCLESMWVDDSPQTAFRRVLLDQSIFGYTQMQSVRKFENQGVLLKELGKGTAMSQSIAKSVTAHLMIKAKTKLLVKILGYKKSNWFKKNKKMAFRISKELSVAIKGDYKAVNKSIDQVLDLSEARIFKKLRWYGGKRSFRMIAIMEAEFPKSPIVTYLKAFVYFSGKQYEKALPLLLKLKKAPYDFLHYEGMMAVCYKGNDDVKYKDYRAKALKVNPRDFIIMFLDND